MAEDYLNSTLTSSNITNYKGLKGLKGINDLSEEDYLTYKRKIIELGLLSISSPDAAFDRIYRNEQFVKKYGRLVFDSYSAELRDKIYENDIISDAVKDKYKGLGDLESILDLLPEFLLEYLERVENDKKHLEKIDKLKNYEFPTEATKLNPYQTSLGYYIASGGHNTEYTKLVSDLDRQTIISDITKRNALSLEVANRDEILDTKFKLISDITDNTEYTKNDGTKISALEFVDEVFLSISKGSNYFQAFKDKSELDNFSESLKLGLVASYLTIAKNNGLHWADLMFDTSIELYIHEVQPWYVWEGNALKKAGINAVAEELNIAVAANELVIAAEYGEEGVAKYRLGIDPKTNKPLPMTLESLNPVFLQKALLYNTFDAIEMLKADKNGGISPYNNVYEPGTESDFWNARTFFMMLELSGYIAANVANDLALAGVGKALSLTAKGTRAALTAAKMAKVASKIPDAKKVYDGARAASAYINLTASSVGLGEMMALDTFTNRNETGLEGVWKTFSDNANIFALEALNNPETSLLVKEEIDKRFLQYLLKKGITLNGDRIPIDTSNSDAEVYNLLRDEVVSNFLKLRQKLYLDEHLEDLNKALLNASIDAAISSQITGGLTTLKELMLGATWSKWTMGRNTSKYFSKSDYANKVALNEGLFISTINKPWELTKRVGETMFGEGVSEFTDSAILNFAEGFGEGLNRYNLQSNYDPYNTILYLNLHSAFLSGLLLGGIRLGDTFTDKNAWIEAGMGFLSPFDGPTMIIGTISNRYLGGGRPNNAFYGKAEGEKLNFAERLNKYLYNPLLDAYFQTKALIREHEATIELINNSVELNKLTVSLLQSLVTGFILADKQNKNGSVIDAIDLEKINIITMLNTLKELKRDPLISQSTIILLIDKEILGILLNTLSALEKNTLINKYINNHSELQQLLGKGESEIALNLAWEEITKNIKDLVDSYNKYNEIYLEVTKLENSNIPGLAEHITKSMFLLDDYKRRLSSIEESISGLSTPSTERNLTAIYGTKSNYDTVKQVNLDKILKLLERIDKLKTQILETKQKLESKNYSDITKKSILERDTRLGEFTLEYLENDLMQDLLEEKLQIEEDKISLLSLENLPVLSAEDIMKLSPKERLAMINNKRKYSAKLQKQISEVLEKLNSSKELLSKFYDSADMEKRIAGLEKSVSKFSDARNAELISDYIDVIRFNYSKKYKTLLQDLYQTETNLSLETVKDNMAEFKKMVFNYHNGNGISEEALDFFIKTLGETWLNNYKESLKNIKDILKLENDIKGTLIKIFNELDNKNTSSAFMNLLKGLIEQANNVNEAILNVEKAALITTDPINKKYLEDVLKKLEEMNYQRLAVPEEVILEHKKVLEEKKKQETKKELLESKNKPTQENTQESTETKEKEGSEETLIKDSEEEVDLFGKPIESPTIEELSKEVETALVVSTESIPETIEENELPKTSSDLIAANPFVSYDKQALLNSRVLVKKEAAEKGDTMDLFYTWLEENRIKLLDIIDNELADIVYNNPDAKVLYLFTKPTVRTDGKKDAMLSLVLLVIENTKEVSKYHHKEYGTILSNGKDYIVIGTQWVNFDNEVLKTRALELLKNLLIKRKLYFDAHPNEKFYVDLDAYTYVHTITQGDIIYGFGKDALKTYRGIADLANGEISEANPEGLSIEDLKWGILKDREFAVLGMSDRNRFTAPSREGNSGSVYLFVRAGNGVYIPVFVRPTFYSKDVAHKENLVIKNDSKLKLRIDNLIDLLTSNSLLERLNACKELSTLLVFSKQKGVLVNKDNSVTILLESGRLETFTLDASFDRGKFLNTISNAGFRINVTLNTLSSPSSIKEYSDAGALNVDIAKLGTASSIFDIYASNVDGTPIVNDRAKYNLELVEKPEKAPKLKTSALLNGKLYRKSENKVYDELGKEITDSKILEEVGYIFDIESRGLSPLYTDNNVKGKLYYAIREGNNPIVVEIDSNNNLRKLSILEAKQTIEKSKKIAKLKELLLNATKSLTSLENLVSPLEDILFEGEETKTETDEVVTELEMIDLSLGKFDTTELNLLTTSSEKTTLQELQTEKKPVNKPKADINDVNSISVNLLLEDKKSTTFTEIYTKQPLVKKEVVKLFEEKGWGKPKNLTEMKQTLTDKGISIEDISDVEAWLDNIRNCK